MDCKIVNSILQSIFSVVVFVLYTDTIISLIYGLVIEYLIEISLNFV